MGWLQGHSWGEFDIRGARSVHVLGYVSYSLVETDHQDWLCAGFTPSQLAQGGSRKGRTWWAT